MAKLFVGIALVVFCGFCGYILSKKYRLRKEYYRQLFAFNRSFLSEISFSRRPIEEWIEKTRYTGEFDCTLKSYLTALKSGDAKLDTISCPEFFSSDEKNFLHDYFFSLGRGDSAGQKGYFTAAEKTLGAQKESAEKDAARYCDLYVKMGVLLGLTLLILLI